MFSFDLFPKYWSKVNGDVVISFAFLFQILVNNVHNSFNWRLVEGHWCIIDFKCL